MAYRDDGLPQSGSYYGPTLRSEPELHLAELPARGAAGSLTGAVLVGVLLILGLIVGIGTLSVGGVGETPAGPGDGALRPEAGLSGGTISATPRVAPVN